jgi:hypothetical protein
MLEEKENHLIPAIIPIFHQPINPRAKRGSP